MVRALVIHGEAADRGFVEAALAAGSIDVHVVPDGPEGLELLAGGGFDVVVVDVMLPSLSGLAVLHEVRRAHGEVAVVVYSSSAEPAFAVIALEADADDYCVRPVSERELLLRVQRAIERRRLLGAGPAASSLVTGDGLAMDPESRVAVLDGVLLDLTVKEFDLLHTFASAPDRVFSRDELLALVWRAEPGAQSVDTVTEHVYRLRGKLDAAGSSRRWIDTVRGAGYRFTTPPAPTSTAEARGGGQRGSGTVGV